jgi:hypothetical protein
VLERVEQLVVPALVKCLAVGVRKRWLGLPCPPVQSGALGGGLLQP